MPNKSSKKLYESMPETPGVYFMKDAGGNLLYVGKAANLYRRVSSYFERPHDLRIEKLVERIAKIDYKKTETALEALILEARMIKELAPPWNVKEKDDKSFLYIEITRDEFPRVVLTRGHDMAGSRSRRWGPFTSASSAREALRILRRIFPWSTHDPLKLGKFERPCFDYEIGLCPGTCVGAISRTEYRKNISRLAQFLNGGKGRVIGSMEKEMAAAAKRTDFEKAAKLRSRIFALKHIQDTALISGSEVFAPFAPSVSADAGSPVKSIKRTTGSSGLSYRIECYDISNISGKSAVGSMVVFEGGEPQKSEYRKFRIKTFSGANDVGMLSEVLGRRFRHLEGGWRLPDLVLVDGGLAQANVARRAIRGAGLNIPILGIAKGPERKRNDIIGKIPDGVRKETLIRARDEAHRFAITYHKKLRGRAAFE